MRLLIVLASLTSWIDVRAGQTQQPAPIVDVHLHASPLEWFPRRPPSLCAGAGFRPVDPRGLSAPPAPVCETRIAVAPNNEELMRATLAILERRNIRAVTIGLTDQVTKWRTAAPNRVIPALLFAPTEATVFHPIERIDTTRLRQLFRRGEIQILGEIESQYQGVAPDDPVLEPFFALAEELDVPVGIHIGPGPAGAAYGTTEKYRSRLGNPLLLEEVLIRHPKLRLYVMHAGWPLADEMILLMHGHPQVYVDISVIDWLLPRREFHRYLRRLVEAGFGSRIMFGSDMFMAPGIIEVALDAVETADFLTVAQKRDILYNNAARFLRLEGSTTQN